MARHSHRALAHRTAQGLLPQATPQPSPNSIALRLTPVCTAVLIGIGLHLGSALLPQASSMAHAQTANLDDTAARSYNIPAGALGTSLATFASQSGLLLSFDPALTSGLNAPALSGSHTVRGGLERLLAGSGLEVVAGSDDSYALRRAPRPVISSGVDTLPEVVVTASPSQTTEGTGSYTAQSISAATGLSLSLRETPQSTTVITSQQIRDRGYSSITTALENTTGFYMSNDFARPSFTVRGFSVSNITVDGTLTQPGSRALSNLQSTNTVAYDSITVVRGANGLLTGTGDPSASVNLVRKRATREFQGYVDASASSWSNYGLEADVSGALNADGTLRGRIAAGSSDGDYFIDHKGRTDKALFATIEADVTPRTTMRAGYHLDHSKLEGMSGQSSVPLFYSDGSLIDLPVSWGDTPRIWSQKQNTRTVFAGLEHSFNNGWQIDGVVNYSRHARTNPQVIKLSSNNAYPNRDGSWDVSLYDYTPTPIKDKQWSYDLNLQGPLQLFGREHELLAKFTGWDRERTQHGVDYSYTLPDGFLDAGLWDFGEYGFLADWSEHPYPSSRQHTEQHGGLLAARWNVSDTVKLITGARLTSWKTYTDNFNSTTGVYSRTSGAYKVDNELTPYLGVTWDFHPNYTAYASYADVFTPQNYYDRNDNLLEPIVGKSYEIGVKGEFFNRRLNASAALFRSLKDNLAVLDPDFATNYLTPGGNTPYTSAGKGNKAQGLDLEIAGALTPHWNIGGGYVYTSLKDGNGDRLEPNTPEHVLRIFTSYRLAGALRGLTLGGGVNWNSHIERDLARPTGAYNANGTPVTATQTFRQSGVAVVNVLARYQATDNLSLSLNVDNLFDKKYFSDITASAWGIYGTPRRYRLGARYEF